MNRKIALLLASAVLFALGSCSNIDPEDPNIEITEESAGKLISAQFIESVPLAQQINGLVGSVVESERLSQLIEGLSGNAEVISYRIVYTTKDNKGKTIQLSGDVAWMYKGEEKTTLESVSLFHPAFATAEEHALEYEQYCFPGRSIHGALVVYPHYQGVFEGRKEEWIEGRPVTTSELILKARQAVDLEVAALSFIESLPDVEMNQDYYTENMGLSCGAGTALATCYILENDPDYIDINSEKIHLYSTYLCEGCYSYSDLLPSLMKIYDYDPDDMSSFSSMEDFKPTAMLSFIIGTFDTWKGIEKGDGTKYFDGIEDVREYFDAAFLSCDNLYADDGTHVTDPIQFYRDGLLDHHSRIFKKVGFISSTMINRNFVNADGELDEANPHIKALLDAMKNNDKIIEGWHPETMLTIAHSYDDEFVPVEQATDLYKNLKGSFFDTKVQIKLISGCDHTEGNQVFAITDLILSKHPCR